MQTPPAVSLRVDGVGKSYGRRRVLEQITFAVAPGEVVTVVGRNGSGKSTLLKIVAALLRSSRGSVSLEVEGKALDTAARRRTVGYASPDLALYPELTGAENLHFFSTLRGARLTRADGEERLEQVGLQGRGGDLLSSYSSGMTQRLRLAFATLVPTPLLLLDEPSLALDEGGMEMVAGLVARQQAAGGATLLATNDAREKRLGERSVDLGS